MKDEQLEALPSAHAHTLREEFEKWAQSKRIVPDGPAGIDAWAAYQACASQQQGLVADAVSAALQAERTGLLLQFVVWGILETMPEDTSAPLSIIGDALARYVERETQALVAAAQRVSNLNVEEANFKGDEAEWRLILVAKLQANLDLQNALATHRAKYQTPDAPAGHPKEDADAK